MTDKNKTEHCFYRVKGCTGVAGDQDTITPFTVVVLAFSGSEDELPEHGPYDVEDVGLFNVTEDDLNQANVTLHPETEHAAEIVLCIDHWEYDYLDPGRTYMGGGDAEMLREVFYELQAERQQMRRLKKELNRILHPEEGSAPEEPEWCDLLTVVRHDTRDTYRKPFYIPTYNLSRRGGSTLPMMTDQEFAEQAIFRRPNRVFEAVFDVEGISLHLVTRGFDNLTDDVLDKLTPHSHTMGDVTLRVKSADPKTGHITLRVTCSDVEEFTRHANVGGVFHNRITYADRLRHPINE